MRKLIGLALVLAVLPTCGNAKPNDLMRSLERLAKQDNGEAIYHLGMAYQTGSGVVADPDKALAAFRRSAALGDALGAYKLGCLYDGQGQVLPRDADLALKHKLVAAEAGYALAQHDVAALYAEKGDFLSAAAWLEKAAGQGWPGSLVAYASIHNGAEGVPADPIKTAAYFRLYLSKGEASEKQRNWLEVFELGMTPEQKSAAQAIVSSYRARPTPLTLKALSGQRAAERLVAASD